LKKAEIVIADLVEVTGASGHRSQQPLGTFDFVGFGTSRALSSTSGYSNR
jgi:hypothetical protein